MKRYGIRQGNISFFIKLKSLESIKIPEFVPDFDPGMVISLNILTQLESQLLNCIKKRSDISEEELLPFQEKNSGKAY